MEAARTYETSVDIQLKTRQYIPEDSEIHTRRRENLKSHIHNPSMLFAVDKNLYNSVSSVILSIQAVVTTKIQYNILRTCCATKSDTKNVPKVSHKH
jgi:hypothetical protein